MNPATSEQKITYIPSATMRAFHADNHEIRGVRGPIGSGKSSGMVCEAFIRAREQAPDSKGVRYTRGVCVRNTYPELRQTTIKTWLQWLPMGRLVTSPTIHWHYRGKSPLGDGTRIDMEVDFISLDRPDDIKKLKSLEVTWAWVNEASEIKDKTIIDYLHSRTGRFPQATVAPLTWSGMWMDTNSMDEDHWWYAMAEVEKPNNAKFFSQPPALVRNSSGGWNINPDAENVEFQPKGAKYWLDLIEGKDDHWRRVNVLNEYGVTADGRPVYPEYSDQRHCSTKPVEIMRGLPVWIGFDFGHCAAVFCQLTLQGQLRIIDELYSEGFMGVRQFLRDCVKPHINANYAGMILILRGDPAGVQRSQVDERTCFEEAQAQGLAVEPASSQSPTARQEAVKGFLLKRLPLVRKSDNPLWDGGVSESQEGLLLDPKCKRIRKGFIGKYFFKRVPVNGTARYADEPEKGEYSHLADCLQYVAVSMDRPKIQESIDQRQSERYGGGQIEIASDYPLSF
jgi:hypothetical protein